MKLFFVPILSLLASLFILPAFAAPLNVLETRAPAPAAASADAQKVIAYIGKAGAAINPICFYSGQTQLAAGGKKLTSTDALQGFQKARNCKVISNIVAQAGVNPAGLTQDDWRHISKALAEHVGGKAYILLGQEVRSTSVYILDERPALKANKNVDVEIWEIAASGTPVKTAKTKATM